MSSERGSPELTGSTAMHHQPPRWMPAVFLKLSVALHVGCGMIVAMSPEAWAVAAVVVAANHLTIMVSVFCPRGQLLGPNILRLPAAAAMRREVALTFDDGPDPHVTPHALNLLDRYGMKATFFCVGARARAYPDLVRDIVSRGHSIENHSDAHVHWFAAFGPRRMAREIEQAQALLTGIGGHAPLFFRAPNGFRNPWLDALLARRGLRYVSWSRRGFDSIRSDPQTVADALTRKIQPGEILLMHDGSSARTRGGDYTVLVALPLVLERLRAVGLTSVTLRHALRAHQR